MLYRLAIPLLSAAMLLSGAASTLAQGPPGPGDPRGFHGAFHPGFRGRAHFARGMHPGFYHGRYAFRPYHFYLGRQRFFPREHARFYYRPYYGYAYTSPSYYYAPYAYYPYGYSSYPYGYAYYPYAYGYAPFGYTYYSPFSYAAYPQYGLTLQLGGGDLDLDQDQDWDRDWERDQDQDQDWDRDWERGWD